MLKYEIVYLRSDITVLHVLCPARVDAAAAKDCRSTSAPPALCNLADEPVIAYLSAFILPYNHDLFNSAITFPNNQGFFRCGPSCG